jgi:hypothetical protein
VGPKHSKQDFILIFDIPWGLETQKRMLNRELHRIGAELIQQSVWRSNDLDSLLKMARRIRDFGGRALILREVVIFRTTS